MAGDFDIMGKVTVDGNGSVAVADIDGKLEKLGNTSDSLGDTFGQLGGIVTNVFANLISNAITSAVTSMAQFVSGSVAAAQEAAASQRQLESVLISTKGVAGVTADTANDLASSLSNVTKFSDDTILSAENMLLTFTNIHKNVFPQATQTILDMSQALGQDTKSSAIQLGKALNDPIQGVTALQRVGVTFTAQQKQMIAHFVQMGDVASAQGLILKELGTEFGGSAKAAATPWDILQNKLGQFQEMIGGIILPLLNNLADAFSPILDAAQNVFGTFTSFMEAGLNPLQAFGQAFSQIFSGTVLGQAGDFMSGIGDKVEEFTGFLSDGDDVAQSFAGVLLGLGGPFSGLGLTISKIGSTAQDIFPDILKAGSTVVEGLQSLFNQMATKVMPFLMQQFGNIGNWFNDNGPLIGGAIRNIAAFFTDVMVPAIIQAWAVIAPIFDGIIGVITGLATTVLDLLNGRWLDAMGSLGGVVMKITGAILAAFLGLINGILGIFGTDLPGLAATWRTNIEMLGTIVSTVFAGISTSVQNGVNDTGVKLTDGIAAWGPIFDNGKVIVDHGTSQISDGLSAWGPAWENLKTIVSQVMANIGLAINTGVNNVTTFISGGLAAWGGIFGNLVTIVTTTFNNIVNGVRQGAGDFLGAVTDGFNNAVTGAQGIVGTFTAIGSTVISNIVSGINGAIGNVTTTLQAGPTVWIAGIQTAIADFANVGANIIAGLVSGIVAHGGDVLTAIINACSGAVKAALEFFHISSPSKLMANMGMNVMLGLQQGIQDNARAPIQSMTGVAGQMVQAVNGGTSTTNNTYYFGLPIYSPNQGGAGNEMQLFRKG